jgi:hypothetical protein
MSQQVREDSHMVRRWAAIGTAQFVKMYTLYTFGAYQSRP